MLINVDKEILESELQLADDECCIIFDLGCYFPFAAPENLILNFALGSDEFPDFKLNNRYPNKLYKTLSKKSGRKISKLGYPFIMKLDEQSLAILSIRVGVKDNCTLNLVFPLNTSMTKENPISYLQFKYFSSFDDKYQLQFSLSTIGKDDKVYMRKWYSPEVEDDVTLLGRDSYLKSPQVVDKHKEGKATIYTLLYNDVIALPPVNQDALI